VTPYEEALAAGGTPHKTPYEEAMAAGGQDVTAAPAPAAAPEEPSFAAVASKRVKDYLGSFANVPTLHDVGQSFANFGKGVARANEAIGNAIAHPIDTFGGGAAAPVVRQVMRGVNSNIPLANLAVEHMGGPPETSAEDAARAPGWEDVGSLAGSAAVGKMAGGIASRAVETAGAVADSAANAGGRAAERTFKKLGKGAGESRAAKLEAAGPEAVAAVDKEFGITKAADPRAAVKSAMASVGDAREAAYKAIDAAGEGVDMKDVSKRLDGLEAGFRKHAGTRKFADDVAKLRDALEEQHGTGPVPVIGSDPTLGPATRVRVSGGTAGVPVDPEVRAVGSNIGAENSGEGATFSELPRPGSVGNGRVSVAQLQREISAVSDGAYGGNYVNPKAAAIVQRRTAAVLRSALDEHLETVAKASSEAAQAVDSFYTANGKFQALKAMEPIIKSKAVKGRFAPGFVDKLIDHPAATLGHTAKDLAGSAAARADAVLSRGVNAARPIGARVASAAAPAATVAPAAVPRGPDNLLEQLVARADGGDRDAQAKLAGLSRSPIVAARIDALRRKLAPPLPVTPTGNPPLAASP
jgi:hypothetical protein